MKRLLRIAFVVCLLVWTFESESRAVPIMVAFSGEIDSVTDPGGVLPGGIGIGTSFSGTYVFESDAAGFEFVPDIVFYSANGSISVNVGGNLFSTSPDPLGVVLLNDQPGAPGGILGDGWVTDSSSGCNCAEPGLFFGDTDGSKIADQNDYFVPTSLVGWDLHDFGLFTKDPGTGQVTEQASGLITSLTIVPEPSMALLVGLGLAGLASRRR
jgi:hypothetical protein